MQKRALALAVLLALSLIATAQLQKPPAAPVKPVTDDYYGTKIVDPYRWMENTKDAEFQTWARAQADYTKAVLDSIPGRPALLARIKELDNAGTIVRNLQVYGGRYFYLKTNPGDTNSKLYMRDAASNSEKLLVDPEKLTEGGHHYSIDYFTPSLDGKRVAYGISPGGSENSVIHILDVDTGRESSETIDRAQYPQISWRPDNQSFFYMRLNKLGPNEPPTDKYLRSKNYLHKIGTDPDKDEAVFGIGLSPNVNFAPEDFPFVIVVPGSTWALGAIAHGVRNEVTLYYAPLADITNSKVNWRKLVDVDDDVTSADVHGDDVYLLSHHGAPRFKVLRTSLKQPNVAQADVVVPEGEAVLRTIGSASDALYVHELDGGIGRLLRVSHTGGKPEQVSLPFEGAINELFVDEREPGVYIRTESWTKPRVFFGYNPRSNQLADLKLAPPPPVDFSQIESREVKAKAQDGTMVPLSIIFKRGTPMDGNNPTLLEGYGSYGITFDPTFSAKRLSLLDRGFIYAIAHIRGGSDLGRAWYEDGRLMHKMNTFTDFIACAEHLVAHGCTTPERLTIRGASAGGLLMTAVANLRPDLFKAVVAMVPFTNVITAMLDPDLPLTVIEYEQWGNPNDPAAFDYMLSYSPYENIRPAAYPQLYVKAGLNDLQVPYWDPAKWVARLRVAKTDSNRLLLITNMGAGHHGSSGRYDHLREDAQEYAFLLDAVGS